MKERRRFFRLVSGSALACVAMELFLRYWSAGAYVLDPVFGNVPRPGGVIRNNSEGHATSHWGSLGIRLGGEVPGSTRSILALGDSFTQGLTVDDDEVYTAVLARELARNGVEISVLNAGKSSASSANYVALAPEYKETFHPSWVVVELQPDDLGYDAWQPTKARFVQTGARLAAINVPVRFGRATRILASFRRRLKLVDNGVSRLEQYAYWLRQQPSIFHAGENRATTGAAESAVSAESGDYPVEEEIRLLVGAYEGRVTMLLIPRLEPGWTADAPMPIERRYEAYCRQEGLSCLDLRETYASFLARGESPFGYANTAFSRGHLNSGGHRAAAHLLALEIERLAARGLL